MNKANIDLSVLLIFFTRPDTFEKVFEQVRIARPSKLLLACDGPREGRLDDVENINACKKIVENIDWECEVYQRYSEVNLGCGQGPATAISWAFSIVDKLLILEDDCVANPTLFPFMKEMLDYYENDTRIGLISGFNHFRQWDTNGFSYCFTKTGPTLGWATWKRVWDTYDYYVSQMKDEYLQKILEKEVYNTRVGKKRCQAWLRAYDETRKKKVAYWDIQFGFVKYTQSYLAIVPAGNLIYNIGAGAGATHTSKVSKTKWKPGQVMFMPTMDLEFPIKHPPYVVCDRMYDESYFRQGYPNWLSRIIRLIKRKLLG